MSRPGLPLRRRVWTQPYLPPGPPQHWKVNWGSPYAANLAFLFLPSETGYWDVVRGDVMTLVGTVTPALSPFGRAWMMGVAAGGTLGYATTAGGNKYYQPPTNAFSGIVGSYNPAAISNTPTDQNQLVWMDGTTNNGINLEVRIFGGTPRPGSNVDVAASNSQVLASIGAGITLNNALQSFSICGTYDGATNACYASSPGLGFGSGTGAKTGTPTGMDRVTLSRNTAGLCANRVVIWSAGWFRTVPAADAQTLVMLNGGLPPGLLRHR